MHSHFADIFRRLRARLWPIAVDEDEAGSGAGDSAESLTPLGFGLRPLTPLNTKNGNTTSTVKVSQDQSVTELFEFSNAFTI